MKFKNLTILSILTIALLSGCSDKEKIDEESLVQQKQSSSSTSTQQKTPVFNFKSITGKDIKITADLKNGWKFEGVDAKDKVILLDFWATWCPPCKGEIPHLNNLRKKFGKDFEIIGIEIGQRNGQPTPDDELKQFIKDFDIKYPVTNNGDIHMLFGGVRELNPNGSIPFMIMFGKKGEYLKHYIGMAPEEMLAADIQAAIKMK